MSDYISTRDGVRIHRRSDLKSRARCPSRHHAEKSQPREAREAQIQLVRGTWYHNGIEYVLRKMKANPGTSATQYDVSEVMAKAPADVRAEATDLVKRWQRNIGGFEQILEIESLLSSVIIPADQSPDGVEHRIGGRLDLVLEGQQIWDWKSSWYVPSADEMIDDDQAGAYALMATDEFGWDQVDVTIYFGRWNARRTIRFDMDAIIRVESELRLQILDYLDWESDMEKADPGERRPGRHCAGCPLLLTCDVPTPSIFRDEAAAKAAAGRLLQIDRQAPALREALATYLDEHGEIDLGNAKVGLELTKKREIEDVEALAAILVDRGIDPWRVVKIDKDKLASVLRQNPGLDKQVAHLERDKRSTRVKSSAKGQF